MRVINITFSSEQEKIDFVNKCEADFESKLTDVSNRAKETNVQTLFISGPTCAGKTTTAKKIIDDFENEGKQVTVISYDNFFKSRKEQRVVAHNEELDYDSVDVLNFDTLRECVNKAKPGSIVRVPIYDFLLQSTSGYEEHIISENGIIIFEGIQAVYPEITSLFNKIV